jgi:hypothetical protein
LPRDDPACQQAMLDVVLQQDILEHLRESVLCRHNRLVAHALPDSLEDFRRHGLSTP